MAVLTLYGVNHTLAYVNVPPEKQGVGEQDGKLRVAYDEFTLTAIPDANSTVSMMKIPAGARIVQAIFSSPDQTTTGIWNVGIASDSDYLIASADAGGQGVTKLMSDTANAAGQNVKLTEEQTILLTCTEAPGAATAKMTLAVFYILD